MKYKIMSVLFALFIVGGFILQLAAPDRDISYEERRHLVKFPEVTRSSVFEGRWSKNFDKYVADQFTGRAALRGLKNGTELFVFRKEDVNGIYAKDGGLYANAEPSEKAVDKFAKKLASVAETMPESVHIYCAVIPDKSALIDAGSHLVYDTPSVYAALSSAFGENGTAMTPVYFDGLLTENDFYRTDIHWRQEKLWPVTERLSEVMRFAGAADIEAVKEQLSPKSYAPFYGAYYGQFALPVTPDTLEYLTGEALEAVEVTDRTNGAKLSVYAQDRLGGIDSYDVFLHGAMPCIELENSESLSDRELILFRDSYGSALAPLLAPFYKKITMIDLRYMPAEMISDFVTYDRQDILFLYSTMLANQDGILK